MFIVAFNMYYDVCFFFLDHSVHRDLPVISALQHRKMARGAMGRRKRTPFRATLPLVLAACYVAREISDTFVPAPQVVCYVDG